MGLPDRLNTHQKLGWSKFRPGIDEFGNTDLKFTRREWDLDSEHLVGKTFSEIIPLLIKASRFHPTMFRPEEWIGDYHGGIINTIFFIYEPHSHESKGAQRKTNSDGDYEWWDETDVDIDGNMCNFNPLQELKNSHVGIGWGSKVTLNNLSLPGSFGGCAHFPMFDFVKSCTQENINHITTEIKSRCNLEKFLIIKSSEHGMMAVGVELVSESCLLNIWNNAALMNHYETDSNDVWFDSRWHARSQQNFRQDLGLPNRQQVCGILRTNSIPNAKPFEPVVVAASF